jgi:hypothetical protein
VPSPALSTLRAAGRLPGRAQLRGPAGCGRSHRRGPAAVHHGGPDGVASDCWGLTPTFVEVSRVSSTTWSEDHRETTLREIDAMWQDEGCAPPFLDPERVGGQRVTRFQDYLTQVNCSDPGHVSRALRVFDSR